MQILQFEDFFSWKQEPIVIGLLSVTWQELSKMHNLEFAEDEHDGLGLYKYIVLKLSNGILYLLTAYPDSPNPDKIIVNLQANNKDPLTALYECISILGLSSNSIEWKNLEFVANVNYRIMRQDDNGNIFAIGNFRDESLAVSMAKTLEGRGHKQTYWVEKVTFPQS